MPGLYIPNAGSGASAELVAQSSPDSLDYTILSMASMGYGVLITAADALVSPCKVQAQSSPNATVKVAAGSVCAGGGIYNPAASASLSIASNSSGNPRFDLVVHRIGTGYLVIQGTAAPAPYTAFPAIQENTDVVLAAVYVANGFSSITNAEIIDKRQPVEYYDWSLTLTPPIQQMGSGTSASGTALKTLSVTTYHAGDLVVLSVYSAGAAVTVTAVSGGGVTTWTKQSNVNTNATYGDLAVWYGVVTSSGTATVTITTTATGTITLSAVNITASLGSSTAWTVDQVPSTSTSNAASGSFPTSWNSGYVPELYFGAMSATGGSVGGSNAGFTYYAATGNTLENVFSSAPGISPGALSINTAAPAWTSTAGNNQLIGFTVAATSQPITPAWTGVTGGVGFSAGFANTGAPYFNVMFRRIGDMVQLRGLASQTGSAGFPSTVFFLPQGYHPTNTNRFATSVGGILGEVTVSNIGQVIVVSGTLNSFSVYDGIQFSVS
jgi:hypothetical protein